MNSTYMTDVSNTLAERGARYGSFENHAAIAQGLQEVLWDTPNWYKLPLDVRQCLVVITDKMARICNGDPDYTDNYHDIQGYAKLVEDRLLREQQERKGELFEAEEKPADILPIVRENVRLMNEESEPLTLPTSDRNQVERDNTAWRNEVIGEHNGTDPVNGDWEAVGNYRG